MTDPCCAPNNSRRKRSIVTLIVTVMMISALLVVARSTSRQPAAKFVATDSAAISPEDHLRRMVQAEMSGNVDSYLDCLTGAARQSAQQQITTTSARSFAETLATRTRGITGLAVVRSASDAPDGALLHMERVFVDRNELFDVRVVQVAGEWQVSEVRAVERFVPDIPYGTPVVSGE